MVLEKDQNKKNWLFLFSFIALFVAALIILDHLFKKGIIPWPFHDTGSLREAYGMVKGYAWFLGFSVLAMAWLLPQSLPVKEYFRIKIFSLPFFAGMVLSCGYSFYILAFSLYRFRGCEYWPPVALLSLENAIMEEIVFRLVLLVLLKNALSGMHSKAAAVLPVIIQALFYAGMHFFIWENIWFGAIAFLYGIVLGIIMEKNKSVIPCIICHFCVDIGAIGLPVLALPVVRII